MTTLTIGEARANLYNIVDRVNLEHKPTLLKGKRHNAVLVAEEDWNSLQEALLYKKS